MLQAPDAASARFRVKRTQDVDVHANNLAAWEQRYEQTSGGPFVGEVREWVDADLQVFEEVASCATSQRCRPWQDGVWLGLAAPGGAHGLRFMGREVHGQQLMVSGSDAPFELQVPAGQGLFGLVLRQATLASHWQTLYGQPWPEHWRGTPSVQALSVTQRERLSGTLHEVLRSVQQCPDLLQHDATRRSLRNTLLCVLGDLLMPQALSEASGARQYRRQQCIQRVREWVFEYPETPLTVADLCARLHMTRRTLQNCFHEVLGLSPATYLRTLRLNAVRRALREGPASATVAGIAAGWGFWHMGHFSHDYKALFGETPSQTRTRVTASDQEFLK